MTPWSIGWRIDVVFGGKNTIWTLVKFETDRWAGQLSMIRAIFRSSAQNFWSSLQNHSSKISLFIQLFFCDLYLQGIYMLDIPETVRIFRFPDHKHGQFFSCCTCCCHYSKPDFAFFPKTLFSFEVIFLIWETLTERTELIGIENFFQLIVWKDCWSGCFAPRDRCLFCNGLGFTTNDFQRNDMHEKYF